MQIQITNGSVGMVEIGWMEVDIEHDGTTHTINFETQEIPSTNGFSSVKFADDDSEIIAESIGFKITREFMSELFFHWNNYSNENFRG